MKQSIALRWRLLGSREWLPTYVFLPGKEGNTTLILIEGRYKDIPTTCKVCQVPLAGELYVVSRPVPLPPVPSYQHYCLVHSPRPIEVEGVLEQTHSQDGEDGEAE